MALACMWRHRYQLQTHEYVFVKNGRGFSQSIFYCTSCGDVKIVRKGEIVTVRYLDELKIGLPAYRTHYKSIEEGSSYPEDK